MVERIIIREETKKEKGKSSSIYNITLLLMWQPVKVVEWGIESMGVRGEPTTHATPFKTKPPAVSYRFGKRKKKKKR